jgi:hypothetical protein
MDLQLPCADHVAAVLTAYVLAAATLAVWTVQEVFGWLAQQLQ